MKTTLKLEELAMLLLGILLFSNLHYDWWLFAILFFVLIWEKLDLQLRKALRRVKMFFSETSYYLWEITEVKTR